MLETNLLKELIYNDEKPSISVLLETASTKEIRIVFKKGQVMTKHQTPYPITVELFEGELNFGVNTQKYHLEKGSLVALDGGTPHDLEAITDCIVRLTLSKQDRVQRVKDVIK